MSTSSSSGGASFSTPPRGRPVQQRRVASVVHALVQQSEAQRHASQLHRICERLRGHPELLTQVESMLDIDISGVEKLYRGNRTIGDVPYKYQVGALSYCPNADNSILINTANAKTNLSIMFLWGTGKIKGWALPGREMPVHEVYTWHVELHDLNGRPLFGLNITTDRHDINRRHEFIVGGPDQYWLPTVLCGRL